MVGALILYYSTLSRRVWIGICVVVVSVLCYLFFFGQASESGQRSKIHQNVRVSYDHGAYHEALGYLQDGYDSILVEEEGCELVISVFAQTKKLTSLEQVSRKCIVQGGSDEIASEGLAMSLSSVGRSAEAIQVIEATVQEYAKNARVLATLAQLYIYDEREDKARQYLLEAIRIGDPWSPWLARVFSAKAYYSNSKFLSQVVSELQHKPEVMVDIEKRLLQLMIDMDGMEDEIHQVSFRLKSVLHSQSK